MGNKSYEQYCPIATGLDLVGDRWTLLVLRELAFGPQRFTDLRSALPGIAANLLAERLRGLEAAGLIEQRELPPPAARTVYALTEQGREVRPLLRAVARFGLPYLPAPREGEVRPRMAAHGTLAARLDPVAAAGTDLLVGLDLDGEVLSLHVKDGDLARPPDGRGPDVTVTGSAAALVELCQGTLALADAEPRLRVTGPARARRTFVDVFGLRAR